MKGDGLDTIGIEGYKLKAEASPSINIAEAECGGKTPLQWIREVQNVKEKIRSKI